MTDLTFRIGGTDFSSYVEKGSYKTDLIPIVGSQYTDLNKVKHTVIVRYLGYLEVTLNPMSPAQAQTLFNRLTSAPCTVQYFSFQEQSVVTRTMMPEWDELKDAKERSSGHWVQSITLSFTEE